MDANFLVSYSKISVGLERICGGGRAILCKAVRESWVR